MIGHNSLLVVWHQRLKHEGSPVLAWRRRAVQSLRWHGRAGLFYHRAGRRRTIADQRGLATALDAIPFAFLFALEKGFAIQRRFAWVTTRMMTDITLIGVITGQLTQQCPEGL